MNNPHEPGGRFFLAVDTDCPESVLGVLLFCARKLGWRIMAHVDPEDPESLVPCGVMMGDDYYLENTEILPHTECEFHAVSKEDLL